MVDVLDNWCGLDWIEIDVLYNFVKLYWMVVGDVLEIDKD